MTASIPEFVEYLQKLWNFSVIGKWKKKPKEQSMVVKSDSHFLTVSSDKSEIEDDAAAATFFFEKKKTLSVLSKN